MILVNFKNYSEGQGERGIRLAKIIEEVSRKTGVTMVPIVSPFLAPKLTVAMVGHVDLTESPAMTGYISMEEAKEMGLFGALINHSEHRLPPGTIKKILKTKPKGLTMVTCLQSLGQMMTWGKGLKTEMIAFEPKELIGSKTKSVSTEMPEVIKKMAAMTRVPLLVGAGIKTEKDVKVAIMMGAKGILVSSSVVKAENPKEKLLELARPFSV